VRGKQVAKAKQSRGVIDLRSALPRIERVGTRRTERRLPVPTWEDLWVVAPALARYTEGPLLGDLWKRPDLSPRDRSNCHRVGLIARNQTIEMPYHFNPALDNRVKPSELLHDLSLRPALAPRDRSMVTISALIASGQTAQIPYHLKRALMYRYKLLIIKYL